MRYIIQYYLEKYRTAPYYQYYLEKYRTAPYYLLLQTPGAVAFAKDGSSKSKIALFVINFFISKYNMK